MVKGFVWKSRLVKEKTKVGCMFLFLIVELTS